MECPACQLENPPGSYVCDCGYRFQARLQVKHGAVVDANSGPGGASTDEQKNLFSGPVITGVVTVIVLFVIAQMFDKDSLTPKPASNREPVRESYEIGQTFPVKGQWPCMETREGLSEVAKWVDLGDREEAARQMLRHGGGFVGGGSRVKLLDRAWFGDVKVRVMESLRECWIPSEAATR